MIERLKEITSQLSSNIKAELQILCYDGVHNRVFPFSDFYDYLDPSDFSEGSLDLIVSIECKEFGSVGAFRLTELPANRNVGWVGYIRINTSLEHTEEYTYEVCRLIASYFNFKIILINTDEMIGGYDKLTDNVYIIRLH